MIEEMLRVLLWQERMQTGNTCTILIPRLSVKESECRNLGVYGVFVFHSFFEIKQTLV